MSETEVGLHRQANDAIQVLDPDALIAL